MDPRVRIEWEGEHVADFLAVVREAVEECAPAELPEARLLVRRRRRDHVVRLLSWPWRAWRGRKARQRARERRVRALVGDAVLWVAAKIALILDDDPPSNDDC